MRITWSRGTGSAVHSILSQTLEALYKTGLNLPGGGEEGHDSTVHDTTIVYTVYDTDRYPTFLGHGLLDRVVSVGFSWDAMGLQNLIDGKF